MLLVRDVLCEDAGSFMDDRNAGAKSIYIRNALPASDSHGGGKRNSAKDRNDRGTLSMMEPNKGW